MMQDLPPGFRLEPLPAPRAAPSGDGLPPGFRLEPLPAAPAAPRRAPTGGGRQAASAPAAAPVDDYGTPMIRDVQRTAEGTTYVIRPLAPEDTDEKLTAEGRYFNPTTNTWEFPRGLEDVEVQGGVERLPMQGDAPAQAGPLEQAGSAVVDAYRSNPVTRQFLNFSSGAARGVQRVAGGAYGLLGQAADRLGLDGIGNAMINQADAYQARANQMNAPQRADNLLLNQTGQFVGEVAATAPVAGAVGRGIVAGGQGLARVAPRAGQGLEALGRSTAAGGFLPSAVGRPTAGMAPAAGERLLNLGTRAAGGAISGGTQAALINEEDAAAGATIGALLPTVAARPAKFALNRLLDGYQALVGELGQTRAADIIRRSLGVDYDVAVTALRNAAPDVTAQQALVDAGVEPSAFMGVGAAVRGAEPDAFLATEAAQRTARQAPIDRLAGGANLTEAQLAQRAEKEALRGATVPMQRAELAAADASGALDVAPVSAALMAQADAPGVGTTNSRVLAEIAVGLDALAARRGGVASADDLYAFRKDDLDDIISRSLSGQRGGDVTSQAARRSELVRSAQQMLDDAIEAAGGTGWRDYLSAYASGSDTIRRQAMMGVAGRQLRQNPNAFVNLVEGETPDVVSGVFGGNRIDLRNLMNPTGVGPSGMDALADAARQIRRDERIGVLAGEGRGVARELLQQAGGGGGRIRGMATLVGRVLRPGTAAAMDVGSALLDAKIAPQVRRELAQAYQSGASMMELLAMTPLADRAQVARNLQNPAFWAHLQGGAVNAMTGNGEQPNAMSPAPQ
jgi:hypothetical protein